MPSILVGSVMDSLDQWKSSAISDKRGARSFAEVAQEVTAWARTLHEKGFREGDLVALRAGNSRELAELFLAVLRIGAIPVLTDPALHPRELVRLVEQCGIRFVLMDEHAEEFELEPFGSWYLLRADPGGDAPRTDPTTEFCRLSSGSTRLPACIEFSGTASVNAARSWIEASRMTTSDSILCLAGLYNGLSFNTSFVPALLSGADLTLWAGRPTAREFSRAIKETSPSVVVAFPAAYDGLARWTASGRGLDSVPRLALSSAAKLSEATRDELARVGMAIGDYWGIAETGPVTFNTGELPGQGRFVPGAEVRVSDGIAAVRTSSMGTRYLNYPGELESRLTSDGMLRTADEIRVDAEGCVHLLGRADRVVEVGGRKFRPDEVEDVLRKVAGVADVAVGSDGRTVWAAYVCQGEDPGRETLLDAVREALASFKVPTRYVRVDHIPRTGSGKVSRSAIETLVSDARIDHDTTPNNARRAEHDD